jgi:RNA polymerase sigma-70 factor (ECF subfamily)
MAREELAARFLPILRRWARGRLPPQARSLADTDDVVQVCLVRALNNIESFEARREGDFLAYMRKTLLNAMRDEIRRPLNRSIRQPPDETIPASGPSQLEEAIGRDVLDTYEAALADLTEPQQHAVILRVEFGYTHAQVAEALGLATGDAARMLAARAVVKLADALNEHRHT